jgi:N-acetylmuramoyl-L-alanine amidase
MRNIRYFCSFFSILIIIAAGLGSFAAQANSLEGIRIWPSPDETRVVMDLSSEVHYSYFTLSHPYRLVIDLQDTRLASRLPIRVKQSPVLSQIRKSTPPTPKTYRLVFELKKKISPQVFKLPPTPKGEYGHRLVVDLPHGTSASQTTLQQLKVSKDASQFSGNADIVVAIDAGHGGEDPGSIGPGGRYEKNVTLSIAKKLAARLDAVSGIKAILTRRGDYYVNLNRRSEIARKNKAHLLISIHADAFTSPKPRGASVFVLNTRRANSEIAKWVEDRERQSELLGGAGQVLAKNNRDKNISQTLLDLQFSHSQKEGYTLGKDIITEIGKVAHLHRRKPVNASLAVLKSPDIPSVLVETGFISNPTEERLLFKQRYQNNLAGAMAKAVVRYFDDNPPPGTFFANRRKSRKHIVQRGESLSLIAQRYGVTTEALKKLNRLKSTQLNVHQVLVIPSHPQRLPGLTQTKTAKIRVVFHTVKPGEYLGLIASRYKVSVAAIKSENNLRSTTLKVGQRLKISMKSQEQSLRKHHVRRGDYLSKIANLYGVSIESIRRANQLRSDTLKINQVLVIPNR